MSARRLHDRLETPRRSADEVESVFDSEDPVSSVIRLPRPNVDPVDHVLGRKPSPPPLPPKPIFARAAAIPNPNAPPPLPPKPENVHGEKLVDLAQKTRLPISAQAVSAPSEHSDFVQGPPFISPPTRPLPAIPKSDRKPSYGEEGSWAPSNLDERSQVDPPQPPEPTIISDGEPIKSSLGLLETSTQSLSDPYPNLTLPLPPPPYTAQDHKISSMFPPIPSSSEHGEQSLLEKFIFLSAESAEDSEIGALVLSRERNQRKTVQLPLRPAPIQWRLYTRHGAGGAGGEAWSVLQEYLTNTSLKVRGRNRALQLLTGYVISACLESTEAGTGLLSEIVRRMRGAERSERDGSIFTLLLNIGAHASFVHRPSWGCVEEVARKVFSNVVEEMHGYQDDNVMWERALRCYLALLRSSNRRPSDNISSRCLAALALHLRYSTHTDIDHVLISEGLCPRLQYQKEDLKAVAYVNYDCLKQVGGIETVLTLYADTASLSARHSLFRVIYDYNVLECLDDLPNEDHDILRDHILTFRSLLEAYEMADFFVHTFRVGPWSDFVVDTIRIILFDPLCQGSQDSLCGRTSDDSHGNGKTVLQEKTESLSLSDTRLSGTIGRAYRSSTTKYLVSIRAMVKLLDKPFCLKVLQLFQEMAEGQACLLAQRESMHFAREWKILCDIETQLQKFVYGRYINSKASLTETLTKIYTGAVDITSGRSNLRSVLKVSEMAIEFFTVKTPFSKRRAMMPQTAVESTSKLFLRGQLIVSRELLKKANPSIFTLLLNATRTKVPFRRLSECRQCLIEILGSAKENSTLLQAFIDNDDAAVAYRASELLSKFTDNSLLPNESTSVIGDKN